MSIYNEIYNALHEENVKTLFDTGYEAYSSGDYETAIKSLEQVVAVNEKYENGYALYYLARSYEKQQEKEKAVEMFQKFVEDFPGTERASYSSSAIARLQQ
jgi:tetratricopeptide (TPR) repeat protein